MKIRMLTLMAGPDGVAQAGTVLEVSAERGASLVAGKFAIAVDPEPVEVPPAVESETSAIETATEPEAVETAAAPENKRGRRR